MPNEEGQGEPEGSDVVEAKSSKPKSPRNMTPIYMVVIAVVFLAIGFVARGSITGSVVADSGSQDAIAAKVVGFLQSRLSLGYPGIKAELAGINSYENISGLYEVNVKITYQGQTQTIPYYATSDGKFMIAGITDLNAPMPEPQEEPSASAEIPKSDKPNVELFVMSFCPYGVQAEQAMAPVVDLLGGKADIKVRFIASASGSDLNSVQSLHGVVEGKEDARQLCIAKNYDTATYWKYLNAVNADCYPIYRNGEAAYDACWKSAAANASIDVTKIENCMSTEGVALINAEDEAAGIYGVSGSPTLIINGVVYSGARTPEAFKSAICNAFNNAPSECGQTLSAAGSTTPSGEC